jgi:hypothetical protein
LLEELHADALISDAFWYIICKICNPKPEFEQHQEFLLDRISANYVSFTLIEDPKYDQKGKEQFFKKFYDIIAQSVYYSLYYAYPKSRKTLDQLFMRELTNTFSELFTGTQIHSASHDHWDAQFVHKAGSDPKKIKDASLADQEIDKRTKGRREILYMRYSPLVERYLITHNYETINNVSKWKMLLTQRTETNKDMDKKFKKFKQITDQSTKRMKNLNEEYNQFCSEVNKKNIENKKQADEQLQVITNIYNSKKENGDYTELSNIVASITLLKESQGNADQ